MNTSYPFCGNYTGCRFNAVFSSTLLYKTFQDTAPPHLSSAGSLSPLISCSVMSRTMNQDSDAWQVIYCHWFADLEQVASFYVSYRGLWIFYKTVESTFVQLRLHSLVTCTWQVLFTNSLTYLLIYMYLHIMNRLVNRTCKVRWQLLQQPQVVIQYM